MFCLKYGSIQMIRFVNIKSRRSIVYYGFTPSPRVVETWKKHPTCWIFTDNLIFDVLIFKNYENIELCFVKIEYWPNLVSRRDVDKSVFATKTLGGRTKIVLKKLKIENLTKFEDRCYLYFNNLWRPENVLDFSNLKKCCSQTTCQNSRFFFRKNL